MGKLERADGGRFAVGNPGGPGRPRRAVEREYLAVFGDELTLDRWRRIVRAALDDAENGDAKAREWIAKYALGSDPARLFDLAAAEAANVTAEDEVADVVRAAALDDVGRMIDQAGGNITRTLAVHRRSE